VSAIGAGPRIYNAVANDASRWIGNLTAFVCALWIVILFVFDVITYSRLVQVPFGLVLFGLGLASTILRGISYPWAAAVLLVSIPPFFVGFLRVEQPKLQESKLAADEHVSANQFYKVSGYAFLACGIVVLICWGAWQVIDERWWSEDSRVWLAAQNTDVYRYVYQDFALSYTGHCVPSKKEIDSSIRGSTEARIKAACTTAETVWVVQWSAPLAVCLCNSLCAVCCMAFSRTSLSRTSMSNVTPADRFTDLKFVLKCFVLTLFFAAAGIYCLFYVSGTSVRLASAALCVILVAAAFVFGWVLLEVDQEELWTIIDDAPLSGPMLGVLRSDWVRAAAVGGLNVFIPITAVLDMIRQRVRRCRDPEGSESGGCYTKTGMRIMTEVQTWNWYSILRKVNLLGMLFILMILGSKLTFIFFSWLNATLSAAELDFIAVTGLVFIIGLVMFLCPIVPGTAVYLFAGVVLGAQAQLPDSVGFWLGMGIGAAACSVAKFCACVMQYSIGYYAGMQVKVQQFVQVDKVPTRAMEQILKQPGMKLDKCSILTAGPDFPTSVLCGILKLDIPQMLLGTIPVIFVSIIPQVLVGGLLTKSGDNASMWAGLSTVVTGLAFVVQVSAMLYVAWATMMTVERDGKNLACWRPEHEAVAKLTEREASFVQAFHHVTEWDYLSRVVQGAVLLSSVAFLASGFLVAADYVLSEHICYRKFRITDQIEDSYELGGLDGNALNIVILPMGAATIGLACFGCVLHLIIGMRMNSIAQHHRDASRVNLFFKQANTSVRDKE